MRRLFNIYILVLLALGVACQRVDLPEVNQPVDLPVGAIGSKATITFSTADMMLPETRGVLNPVDPIIDPSKNVKTLHLIVFDENGMLVEVCEAKKLGTSDHVDENGVVHEGGRHYTVTLTVTDEPRTIHYVANCPVKQVVYGHETSIIGNMFVDRNGSDGAQTDYETSYWARIEVPHILVEEKEVVQPDGSKKIVESLVDDIKDKFKHVPLLRNYAEITVTDKTDNTFYFEGFTVYNLLNRGTVAPYNSNTQEFQSFFGYDENGAIKNYSYPDILGDGYEGHTLTSAKLITDFIRNDDGKVKIYKSDEPFYVYERKVSVMTDEEEKWRESPPHIIIKGKYNNGEPVTDPDNTKSYYYKMDLVYTDKTSSNEDIKYYNILRNFMYQFNLTKVHDVGYDSLEEAVAGAAGNNISGSSSTSKLTNISDTEGRLWVSYTDITLVTNDAVVFRYKYIPNYYDSKNTQTYLKVDNSKVRFENVVGDVITGIKAAQSDIKGGEWDGYREVTISVNAPSDIIRQQILYLKTDNANLNRQIRHTLRKKLTMQVECTPKVKGEILQEMQVDIKLPLGMTDDMFPLMLNMETYDRTLSPDASKNTIPVTAGTTIIDTEDRKGQLSYYYTVTIPTLDAYKELPNDGNMKVYSTHWLTNMANNASEFYVENKYFNLAWDSWENYKYTFENVSCSDAAVGVGSNVTIKFTMVNGAIKPVTISLKGMTYTGTLGGVNYTDATVVKYTPTSSPVSLSGFKTTTATDAVSFTIDADEYNIATAKGERQKYVFDGKFGATSLAAEADVEVDFTFSISEDALEALKKLYPDAGDAGVPMYVTLDRLHPADDKLVYSQARNGGDRYIYRIKQAGTQTIKLATTEDAGGPCTVTLAADYFETENITIQQTDVDAKFNRWEDTLNASVTSSTREFVVIGEQVYYYVNVSAKTTPTSVTIDGQSATRTNSEVVDNTTTWRITWSKNDKNVYPMSATVNIANETYTIDLGNMKVAGLTISNNSTNSLDTTGNTLYVLKNRSSSTYLTAANENLAANTSQNYYNLFTVSEKKIVSVARNEQLKSSNSNNSNITFDTPGTDYTFAVQNTSYVRISYTYTSGRNYTNYIRVSNDGSTVQSSTSTNNNRSDWQVYPVTYDVPQD